VRKILVDTGPLVSALDARDSAHIVATGLLGKLRRQAMIPTPVLAEVDHFAGKRVGGFAARTFLREVAGGLHSVAYLSPGLLRRAVELDDHYADLNLGFTDTCLMAIAERHELPILTFDFADFRATESATGPWRLVLDEQGYQEIVGQ
jgi:predicted nucleic acid-binding protein